MNSAVALPWPRGLKEGRYNSHVLFSVNNDYTTRVFRLNSCNVICSSLSGIAKARRTYWTFSFEFSFHVFKTSLLQIEECFVLLSNRCRISHFHSNSCDVICLCLSFQLLYESFCNGPNPLQIWSFLGFSFQVSAQGF